jgi:hypothetical protein
MIASLQTLLEFNNKFITDLQTKSEFFLPLDSMTNDALINNRIEELRIVLQDSDNSYNYYEELYNLNYSPLTDQSYSDNSSFSEQTPFVYPFSKKQFAKQFFSDCLPSLFNHVFSYMKSTTRIVQIGTGQGKALVFYPVLFTQDDFHHLNPIQYQSVIEAMVHVAALVNNQQADITYLLQENLALKSINSELIAEIDNIQNTRVQDYLTTWR